MAQKVKQQRYLPDDVLMVILGRLPLKSLLRFTSVSKSWNSLIISFMYSNITNCYHLLYLSNDGWKSRQECTLIGDHAPLSDLPHLPLKGCRVIGVCEGLICLVKGPLLYIWNPLIIGSLKKVPASGNPAKLSNDSRYIILGFGYASGSGDYKVVKMIYHGMEAGQLHEVEIYSLTRNSWRKLENCGYNRWFCSSSPVFFKGSIYWMGGGRDNGVILRFDVEEERFSRMDAPTQMENDRSGQITELVVANEFLAVLKVKPIKAGKLLHVWGYIYKESKWLPGQRIVVPKDRNKRLLMITKGGHIILEGPLQGSPDHRIFAYDCYYDAKINHLGFELRDLGIFRMSRKFHLIPIKFELEQVLHL